MYRTILTCSARGKRATDRMTLCRSAEPVCGGLGRVLGNASLWMLLLAVPASCWAQTVNGGGVVPEMSTKQRVVAETEALKKATADFRELLKEMRETMVRFNVGEKSEDKKWRARWAELQMEGVALHQVMVKAAIAEFQEDPMGRAPIAQMLFEILDRNIEADRYQGMSEVAKVLIENGFQDEKLQGYLTMAAYALNDYDVARPNLDALIESGIVSQQLLILQENFDVIVSTWKEELRLREEDAKGEPLPRVLIRTTKGNMEVELFENQAPETVANFLHLAETGFYDHQTFHRVIQHFMAQTGCPNGDGSGGPGYTINGEMHKPNARKFFRGTLGLALAPNPETGEADPQSGGSQFFIMFLPTYELNGNYTAFGRVIRGIDVLANINKINPDEEDEEKKKENSDQMPDEILGMEVLFKRDHEYQLTKTEDLH